MYNKWKEETKAAYTRYFELTLFKAQDQGLTEEEKKELEAINEFLASKLKELVHMRKE